MDVLDFQKTLREKGIYETAADAPRPLSGRLLGWSDTWYYLHILGIVFRAGTTAMWGRYDETAYARSSYATLRLVEACGGKVEISGLAPLAGRPGPAVYIANHMSALETMLLPVMLLSIGTFANVVKETLLRYPAFGRVLKAVPSVSVTRKNPREDLKSVLRAGSELLGRGCSVMVFPQATRRSVFDPAHFNTLGVKLAKKGGVPVVPVALKTDFQGVGGILKDFGRVDRNKTVHFRFGKPLEVAGNSHETHEKVVEFIGTALREWGAPVNWVPERKD